MTTTEQNKRFGRMKAGYLDITKKRIKPTHGNIYLDNVLYKSNLPFALLQYHKRQLITQGYITKRIKISYL
jgi:hypothetical protein